MIDFEDMDIPCFELKKTEEQLNAIRLASEHKRLKINAGAGAAKSTTLSMISEELKVPSLLLVFNKTAQQESVEKFPSHVEVRTTHSMAYQDVGWLYQHKLSRPVGRYVNVAYTGSEIAKFFRIEDYVASEEKTFTAAYIGLLAKRTVDRFQGSDEDRIESHHVPTSEIREVEKRDKINLLPLQKKILKYARKLWKERKDENSPVMCTHDTYMKLWQLSKPILNYDIIYLDEAQDTSACTLDVIRNQEAKVVLVGDKDQQIYGFRFSLNAMAEMDCQESTLTKSFRFGQKVADVANLVLDNDKGIIGNEEMDSQVGEDVVDKSKPYAILYRTNIRLIMDAVQAIQEGESVRIEVDTRDFCKMLVSAKALFMRQMNKVKHDLILPFSNWEELLVEVDNDPEIKRVAKLVEKNQADKVIKCLEKHNNQNPNPHIIFTTAHKSKGLEFPQVVLAGDFPSNYNQKGEWVGLSDAEKCLLYVAATRAQEALNINNTIQEIYNKDIVAEYEAMKGVPVEARLAVLDGSASPEQIQQTFNKLIKQETRALAYDSALEHDAGSFEGEPILMPEVKNIRNFTNNHFQNEIDAEVVRMGGELPGKLFERDPTPEPPKGEMAMDAYLRSADQVDRFEELMYSADPQALGDMYEEGFCDELVYIEEPK